MPTVREVFNKARPLERHIEKVVDYAALDDVRLLAEVGEYEVMPSVEAAFRRLLEAYDAATSRGDVSEIGVWVSGFYGSGKSSFTKYLGLALENQKVLAGQPFVEHLAQRMSGELGSLLRAIVRREPATVFMVDLATNQIADSSSVGVANVLYWNVLRKLGFSREQKVAELEVRLFNEGRLDAFKAAYTAQFPGQTWEAIHDDPLLATRRAALLVPRFYKDDFPTPEAFASLRFSLADDVGDIARRTIELVRRRTGRENVVFFVDEVGQYVAPRKELILNLDGLVRAFKEHGQGRVWLVATAQQTLAETSSKAALNSTELYRLKDRFPLALDLEASDIREITARRLLTKSAEGERTLRQRFADEGERLRLRSTLHGWSTSGDVLDATTYARHYPFLPSRFGLVLDLIRALARQTGGTGLRSAIRLVQDLLVDASRRLPQGATKLADRPLGRLATAEDIYDTLRADLARDHRHAVEAVDRILAHPKFRTNPLAVRVAKAVAVLQPLEQRPRTSANVAAFLFDGLADDAKVPDVERTLQELVAENEFGLVELKGDASLGEGAGYLFLSQDVQPLRRERTNHAPTDTEKNLERVEALRRVFAEVPEVRVGSVKRVQAGVRRERTVIAGEGDNVVPFRLEAVARERLASRLAERVQRSLEPGELSNVVTWVYVPPDDEEDRLADICRSRFIASKAADRRDDGERPDVLRYIRSERRAAERAKEQLQAGYVKALEEGSFVFAGAQRTLRELGPTLLEGATAFLLQAAEKVFDKHHLAAVVASTDLAPRFLRVDRPERMPKDCDPLGFVAPVAGKPMVNVNHPTLQEALRVLQARVASSGRVPGAVLLDAFTQPPYGWTKDATRYVFAALLAGGVIEIHGADGVLRTTGPKAEEAFRNTQAFGKIGVAPRGTPVPHAALDLAARRLEQMFNEDVLPLEDQIARVVRKRFPEVVETVGALPDRLRLLGLPGAERARRVLVLSTQVLSGDASNAASLLGATDATVFEDAEWAREVGKELDQSGEKTITQTRALLGRVESLAEIFPGAARLLNEPAIGVIRDALAAESFHTRLGDMRQAVGQLEQILRAEDATVREAAARDAEAVLNRLQAQPAWRRAGAEVQTEIAKTVLEPLATSSTDVASALQTAFVRRLQLPALEAELRRRLEERARDSIPPVSETEERPAQPVAWTVLVPPDEVILNSEEELDQWLGRWSADLRARLLQQLGDGPIRLTREP